MDNGNVQDAQVVPEEKHRDTLALEALKIHIASTRDNFKQQVADLKNTIEAREEELKNFNIKLRKLQGAVEAAEIYLKQK